MNSAKWSVELEVAIEASIRVLNIFFTFCYFQNKPFLAFKSG